MSCCARFGLLALLLLLLAAPLPAQATTTWSKVGNYVSLCTETTGTGDAPTLVTQGLGLLGLKTVQVCVEPSASTLTNGTLLAYLWNPSSSTAGAWYRAPGLDLTSATAAGSCFVGINFQASGSRIAYVPSGLAVANKIYILGWRN
jgi:hypothetical protein